ncbi:sucrase ferredoxin [Litchfieldella rifensis]|uniref:Sucrase ferredoxin n=1 Tax=Litchfieldella rifensis TaxID=762643 RepID=A0ABV7LRI4_9GAMM
MTAMPRRFCAQESAAIGDPLVGTASHAERNLLISWPRAKWLRSLREASDMPAEVSALIENIAAHGRRVNLIHRQGQPSHVHRIFLMPECRSHDVPREELASFLHALRDGATLERWQTGTVHGSMILCCTHGRKDKCCAKFGYRTYQAIADEAQHHEYAFDVWESTHLGGCRLAASAIIFPQLRKYGRIGIDDIPGLLRAEATGQPYLPCYRGDSRLSPPEQCAQVAALEWLQARGLRGEVSVESESAIAEGNRLSVPVRWQTAGRQGRLVVTCVEYELIRHDTCADYAGDGATPSKVWRATQVTALASVDQSV